MHNALYALITLVVGSFSLGPAVASEAYEPSQNELLSSTTEFTKHETLEGDNPQLYQGRLARDSFSPLLAQSSRSFTDTEITNLLTREGDSGWNWSGSNYCDGSKTIFYEGGEYANVRRDDAGWRIAGSASASRFSVENGVITFIDGRNRGRQNIYPPHSLTITAVSESRLELVSTGNERSILERCSASTSSNINTSGQASAPTHRSSSGRIIRLPSIENSVIVSEELNERPLTELRQYEVVDEIFPSNALIFINSLSSCVQGLTFECNQGTLDRYLQSRNNTLDEDHISIKSSYNSSCFGNNEHANSGYSDEVERGLYRIHLSSSNNDGRQTTPEGYFVTCSVPYAQARDRILSGQMTDAPIDLCGLTPLLSEISPSDRETTRKLYYQTQGAAIALNTYRQSFLDSRGQINIDYLGLFPTFYHNVTVEELRRIRGQNFQYPREKMEQMLAFFDAYQVNRAHWDGGDRNLVEPHWYIHFALAQRSTRFPGPDSVKVGIILQSGVDAHVDHDLARALRYSFQIANERGISPDKLKPDFDLTESTLENAGAATIREIFIKPLEFGAFGVDMLLGQTRGVLARRQKAWENAINNEMLLPQEVSEQEVPFLSQSQPPPISRTVLEYMGRRVCTQGETSEEAETTSSEANFPSAYLAPN